LSEIKTGKDEFAANLTRTKIIELSLKCVKKSFKFRSVLFRTMPQQTKNAKLIIDQMRIGIGLILDQMIGIGIESRSSPARAHSAAGGLRTVVFLKENFNNEQSCQRRP
jgi:hypothetical protein